MHEPQTPPDATAASDHAMVRLLQVVAVAANESTSVEGALQTTLDAVCEQTGWLLGHAWLRQPDGGMVSGGVWHPRQPGRFDRFRELTEQTRFSAGQGLAGQVADTGEPAWIEDVAHDPAFVRRVAADEGLHAAVAFGCAIAGASIAGLIGAFIALPVAAIVQAIVGDQEL